MSGELELLGDDQLVVTKTATTPHDRHALAHEAAMLERAAHPGVVELVSFEDDGEVALLRTEFAGEQTWHTSPPTNVPAIGQGVASLAATIADLHDLAVTHRGIHEDHVIVAPTGRLVLCDLTLAGDHEPSIDVDQLGAMLLRRLDECEPTQTSHKLASALRSVAADATHDDPAKRSTARQLANSVAAAMESWRPTVGQQARTPSRKLGRLKLPMLSAPSARNALAGLAVCLAATALLVFPGDRSTDSIATLATNPAPVVSTSPAPSTLPAAATAEPATPTTSAAPPLVIEHDGYRYAVGEQGDIVATGDWDCDGSPTAAVLRPGSGDLYVFTNWPAPGESAVVKPMTVPDETTEVQPAGLCGHVALTDASGNQVEVPVTVR